MCSFNVIKSPNSFARGSSCNFAKYSRKPCSITKRHCSAVYSRAVQVEAICYMKNLYHNRSSRTRIHHKLVESNIFESLFQVHHGASWLHTERVPNQTSASTRSKILPSFYWTTKLKQAARSITGFNGTGAFKDSSIIRSCIKGSLKGYYTPRQKLLVFLTYPKARPKTWSIFAA